VNVRLLTTVPRPGKSQLRLPSPVSESKRSWTSLAVKGVEILLTGVAYCAVDLRADRQRRSRIRHLLDVEAVARRVVLK
jgi:hypothetical protein